MAKAIVLNGTSSSGKTTLSKTLQMEFDTHWLHFQLDTFWDMLPDGAQAHSKNFPNLKSAVLKSAKALLDTNHNLIIDIVCANYDETRFSDFIDAIKKIIISLL